MQCFFGQEYKKSQQQQNFHRSHCGVNVNTMAGKKLPF